VKINRKKYQRKKIIKEDDPQPSKRKPTTCGNCQQKDKELKEQKTKLNTINERLKREKDKTKKLEIEKEHLEMRLKEYLKSIESLEYKEYMRWRRTNHPPLAKSKCFPILDLNVIEDD